MTSDHSHFKRWLTGIIAVPILIYIIGPGPTWLFHGLLFLVSVVGLFEFFRITTPNLPAFIKVVSAALAFLLFWFISRGPFFMSFAIASLGVIIPLTLYLLVYRSHRDHAIEDTGKIVLGLLYVCLPLSLLIFVDKHPKGNIWIFFLLAVIFMSDTGAFYVGRAFGKHKLYPSVSPGKTWEGAVGGLLSSLLAASIFVRIFPIDKFNFYLLVLAASLSIMGQVGDLAESMLKRSHGVKDSGTILPGHGGVLDRIDALLFSIPILYIFLSWSIR
jgi:phosphatidate cytidylyltransferase